MTQSHPKRAALITGAAGRVGQKLCHELASHSQNIIGLYHEKLPTAHKNLLPLCCDLRKVDSLVAPLKTTDTVIHLAWQSNSISGADEASVKNSANVKMTQNMVAAMEKAGTRRVIFLSWVGVDRHASLEVLREKYWAEHAIINSNIPEKIIIRAGLLAGDEYLTEFTNAAGYLSRIPFILPLPARVDGVVVTTMKDVVWALSESLRSSFKANQSCKIIDLSSIEPKTSVEVLQALDQRICGKRKIPIGGFIGRWLYQMLESKFGLRQSPERKLSDYLSAARLPRKSPADGVPATTYGIKAGRPIDLDLALKA